MDDLAGRMDAGFARVDADIRELRGEMREGFAGLRREIDALRITMVRVGGGVIVALLAAVLVRGA